MTLTKDLIIIDESGTLPDITDKYIVITALVASKPEQLLTILPKFRKKTPKKGHRKKEKTVKEFKFHFVGNITRKKVLLEIISKDIKIYTLVVDKIGRKIADTPENYGKLIKALLELLKNDIKSKQVYLDKHFDKQEKTGRLQVFLEVYAKGRFIIAQVDSLIDSRIDLADFVAGAIFRKYRVAEKEFYDLVSSKVIKEVIKKWNELT